jgi:hypothetical protein
MRSLGENKLLRALQEFSDSSRAISNYVPSPPELLLLLSGDSVHCPPLLKTARILDYVKIGAHEEARASRNTRVVQPSFKISSEA